MDIAFIDLAAQQSRLRSRLDAAIARVLNHGHYIMGPEVADLEQRLAQFCGAKHCISCANGTDALQLALIALGVGAGDAVFVPSFTFAATAEVVPLVGAIPIFIDCLADTFNMDPESLRRALAHCRSLGLRPACVIPVDLFGLPADHDALMLVARENGLAVIDDSAQGFGATYHGRRTGTFGDISTTSFFPAKPLGCYGDGGAVFTDDEALANRLDSLRLHGKGAHKYQNDRIGMNSRLDTLQAAILIEKLAVYQDEIERRQAVAKRYTAALSDRYEVPFVPEGLVSIWAQYTLKLPSRQVRDQVQARARAAGVPTVIYYAIPLHLQNAFKDFPRDPEGLPVSASLPDRVLSLPMHPYLRPEMQQEIIDAMNG